MVYKILWKERDKPASYFATRDGKVTQVSTKAIEHFKRRDIQNIQTLLDELGATMSCISDRTTI